jgi:hypothetical protein
MQKLRLGINIVLSKTSLKGKNGNPNKKIAKPKHNVCKISIKRRNWAASYLKLQIEKKPIGFRPVKNSITNLEFLTCDFRFIHKHYVILRKSRFNS